jgi:hypothetical protein
MWEHLLPAMAGDASSSSRADTELAERLAHLSLPTAAERCGGEAPEVPPMTFAPGPSGPTSHHTVSGIETAEGRMVLREGDRSIEVPLTEAWTIVAPSLAASAARLDDGRVVVDVAFLATPHRLEVELDPAIATFTTRWPLVPLFGGGIQHQLDGMHAPVD